jgi:hypothetical protein
MGISPWEHANLNKPRLQIFIPNQVPLVHLPGELPGSVCPRPLGILHAGLGSAITRIVPIMRVCVDRWLHSSIWPCICRFCKNATLPTRRCFRWASEQERSGTGMSQPNCWLPSRGQVADLSSCSDDVHFGTGSALRSNQYGRRTWTRRGSPTLLPAVGALENQQCLIFNNWCLIPIFCLDVSGVRAVKCFLEYQDKKRKGICFL